MTLSKAHLDGIKKQLFKQLESWPEQQRAQATEEINSMTDEEFEQFLIQNKMIKPEEMGGEAKREEREEQQCIFCTIIEGKIPSYKLDENKSSIAILEINPLSAGHSLVISKNHGKLSNSAFSLANKIAKRLKSKLKAQEVKIENSQVFGHNLINIIPIYKDVKLEKKKAEEKELILLQEKLKSKQRKKKAKKPEISEKKLEIAPRRIP